MEEKQLIYLLHRFLSGTATDSEEKQLKDWYDEQNNRDVVWESTSPQEQQIVKQQMREHIEKHVRNTRTPVFKLPGRYFRRIAAVITGLSIFAAALYFANEVKRQRVVRSAAISAPSNYAGNKYVLLPDSSTVLLHPGSKIAYQFDGKVRQLTLVGEAYFDIKHMADNPFVIHTGKVVTTVLGTAFNIKAYTGQKVIVSVTRGKVSVADESSKLLAILTPDHQVEYNATTKTIRQHIVKAQEAISWVKADMQFDGISCKELAGKLSYRYDVKFKFKNTEVEKCPITGRFNGREPLEQVLNIITETMGTTFKVEGDTIIIDGKGCL